MPRSGQFKVPVPEASYGQVRVSGVPFRDENHWWIPCICLNCRQPFNANWRNLHQGLITQCNQCRKTAGKQRLKDQSAYLADLRRKDEWRWWSKGCEYVYAIAFLPANVMKIGFASKHPSMTVGCASHRFRKFSGDEEARGFMAWHKTPATMADESILQGFMIKAYGAYRPQDSHGQNRVCEWCYIPDVEGAVRKLNEVYSLAQSLS